MFCGTFPQKLSGVEVLMGNVCLNKSQASTATRNTAWETIMLLWKDQTMKIVHIFLMLLPTCSDSLAIWQRYICRQRPWQRLWSAACSVLCVSTAQLYKVQQGVQWDSVCEWVVITQLTVSLRQGKHPLNTKNAASCNEWGCRQREREQERVLARERWVTLLNQILIISLPLTDLIQWNWS